MRRRLASLDRYLSIECEIDQPDRYRQIYEAARSGKLIPRGAGVSYTAASFAADALSIDLSRFDRILDFDKDGSWIEVEAGISLGKLFEFLTPHGLHIPVQPGHPQVTVGGCIAGNVHGKNQFREGVFGSRVQSLTLFHPDHGKITASRDENADVFDLTVGGLGLTGFILSARLSLSILPGRAMREHIVPVADLQTAFQEVDRLKSDYDMIYCWNDLCRTGADAGRGYLVAGSYVEGTEGSAAPTAYKRLDPSGNRRRPKIFSDLTMPWINRIYYRRNVRGGPDRVVPLFEFLYPAVGKEFFFDLFGQSGFIELQALVPRDAIDDYVREFLNLLRREDRRIALTTIKAFDGEQRLLHFNGSGFNFTIEVENTYENRGFLSILDDLNSRFGAITNVMKDSRLTAEVAQRQYRYYGEFRERLHRYDPKRRFVSSLSERLAL